MSLGAPRTWIVGEVVTAALLNTEIRDQFNTYVFNTFVNATKPGDTNRASTVTRTADPDLVLALPASSTWEWVAVLFIASAANAAGDFSHEWQFPANATVSNGQMALDPALPSGAIASLNAGPTGRGDTTSPTLNFDSGASLLGSTVLSFGRIILGVTAGNLTLAWAQLASNVNNTTLLTASYVTARRVA